MHCLHKLHSALFASALSTKTLHFFGQDGQRQDEAGIHHRVLNAIIETPPDQDCYGWLDVFEDHLQLTGIGQLQSSTMSLPSPAQRMKVTT